MYPISPSLVIFRLCVNSLVRVQMEIFGFQPLQAAPMDSLLRTVSLGLSLSRLVELALKGIALRYFEDVDFRSSHTLTCYPGSTGLIPGGALKSQWEQNVYLSLFFFFFWFYFIRKMLKVVLDIECLESGICGWSCGHCKQIVGQHFSLFFWHLF